MQQVFKFTDGSIGKVDINDNFFNDPDAVELFRTTIADKASMSFPDSEGKINHKKFSELKSIEFIFTD